jgi:hypothetical protein
VVEVGPVVDGRDVGGGSAKDLGLPCVLGLGSVLMYIELGLVGGGLTGVEVAVEVDHRDGTVGAVDGAQER